MSVAKQLMDPIDFNIMEIKKYNGSQWFPKTVSLKMLCSVEKKTHTDLEQLEVGQMTISLRVCVCVCVCVLSL